MDNYQGDLTDILRASGGPIGGDSNSSDDALVSSWQFQPAPDGNSPNPNLDGFGDPFSHIRDPLLDELDVPKSPFFTSSALGEGTLTNNFSPKVRPNNFFSRMLQISPVAKLPVISNDVIKANPSINDHVISSVANTSKNSFESSVGLQISSPRNTGIKRRKSQTKKVVCIPAPAPANSRPSGEIVPSDLWAWRKYGQKPIKGSPYPRGYYRCSSSKGCSARKQVERSRTDPNMLVITYTSEHNHPWPTQRNALAGSTRSQPSKSATKNSSNPTQAQKEPLLKEEPNSTDNIIPSIAPTNTNNSTVKEETDHFDNDSIVPMEDINNDDDKYMSYRPLLPLDMMSSSHSDDFFADLGEIGGDDDDPLNLLFSTTTPGFSGDQEDRDGNAFTSFFDWTGDSNTNNNVPSFGDTKKGL